MSTQAELDKLADEKLAAAECLAVAGHYDTAYYLAGYAIELLLKARICKILANPEFFRFESMKQEAYKPFKTHDYEQLMVLAGIWKQFEKAMKADNWLEKKWKKIKTWNEGHRYKQGKTVAEIKAFFEDIKTISIWIKKQPL
ncbi:MAG: hypothetical protein P0Y53_18460 [Candidatus Pseudobacter hemicellulosilyticus]|uniref:HEPN domain-containing protein n=1 Tax=Candidatus Pseudobacter hemicellulosilyticus TaxID=3121375 RepID=A0AAJ6BG72_9BACT|nr:MAG: hypothetical protein P0Y53_18460 [Pseudobacter sp.]